MDRGAWRATAHGVTKELDTTEQLTHTHTLYNSDSESHLLSVFLTQLYNQQGFVQHLRGAKGYSAVRDKRAYLTVWICLSFNFRPCLCEVQPGLPGTEVEVGKKPALSQPRHQQCLIFACFLCLSSASCPYPGLTTQLAVYILQCQMKRRDPFQTASTKHHKQSAL